MIGNIGHLANLSLSSLCFIVALLLFQKGFLLKRQEVASKSSCSDVSLARGACWLPAAYKKAVIMLVDALRYDFVAPPESGSKSGSGSRSESGSRQPWSSSLDISSGWGVQSNWDRQYYRGRLPTFERLLREQNESSVLMHFVADPPTTTMQRLKALTTGSLPTFIDVGSNFAGTAVVEDNWVDQLVDAGRNITFMGDDTWTSLYPTQFHRRFDMPSFDVNDLTSVDNMITEHIYEELARADWNVLIAHVLGVDHCGHKYGPNHEEMAKRLTFVDNMIERITDSMDNETVLIVMGDHGMTHTGDHGGDSQLEIDAALFVHSKKKLLFSDPPNSVAQIDLVPTLSVLLDVPIPFSNVGILIESLISPQLRDWASSSNVWQMVRYAQGLVTTLPQLEPILRTFDANPDNAANQRRTMRQLQNMLRTSFTTFNDAMMRIGILSFIDAFLAVLNALTYNKGVPISEMVFRSGLLLVQCSAYLVSSDEHVAVLDILLSVSLLWRLFTLLLALLAIRLSLVRACVLALPVAHALSYFSNSYIVFESSSVRFLAQSAYLVGALHTAIVKDYRGRRHFSSLQSLLHYRIGKRRLMMIATVLIILRAGPIWERCREEQQESCVPTLNSIPLTRMPIGGDKFLRFISGVLMLAAASEAYTMWEGQGVISSLIRPTGVLTAAVWTAQWLPDKSASQFAAFSIVCAQIVYLIAVVRLVDAGIGALRSGSLNESRRYGAAMLSALCSVLILLLGDALCLSLVGLLGIVYIVIQTVHDEFSQLAIMTLVASHGFFSLAHHATFATIPWHAAFIGVPGNFAYQVAPAFLVGLHIFASYILMMVAMPLVCVYDKRSRLPLLYRTNVLLALSAVQVLCTCLAAALHRRHLMVWKIFAPKFIFEGISFCVLCSLAVIVNVLFYPLNAQLLSLPLYT